MNPDRLAPIRPGTLAGWGVVGVALGWLARPLSAWWLGASPLISWTQPAALFLSAAILLVTARTTRKQLREPVRDFALLLEPHRAVNRLVLGRAAALVGALIGGAYAGHVIAWLGSPAELAHQRMLLGGLAAVGGLLTMIGGVALERACRVPEDPSDP